MKIEWPGSVHRSLMRGLHRALRELWQIEDKSAVERLVYELRLFVHDRVDISRSSHRTTQPPSSHPIQQALLWVRSRFPKLRRCRNVGCRDSQPFFVADGKERYCSSPVCIHEGEKESKMKWWEKHGEKWRAQQRKSKGSPKVSVAEPEHG
jgi:hypothetical protein